MGNSEGGSKESRELDSHEGMSFKLSLGRCHGWMRERKLLLSLEQSVSRRNAKQ